MTKKYKPLLESLVRYLADKGYTSRPYPKFILDNTSQDGVFIRTGYYNPDTREVRLFVNGRHPKDVLRSCAHELIHHRQNLEGKLGRGSFSGELITEDDRLMGLEKEAFLDGNIGFREWTEHENKKR